jgi:hypothetical protein
LDILGLICLSQMKAAVPTTAKMIRIVTPVIEEKASPQHDTATMSKKISPRYALRLPRPMQEQKQVGG